MAYRAPDGMLEKLKGVQLRFENLTAQLSDPSVIQDRDKFMALSKERSAIEELVEKYENYHRAYRAYQGAQELQQSGDGEMAEMATLEIKELEPQLEHLESELQVLLLPQDPNDQKNVMIELRAGVGGDEAGLFVADLYRAYQKFAEKRGWHTEVLSVGENSAGGYRELIASISGERVYSTLKYESGAHRVQRVPKTETQGRIHTSTVTVAIMPEAEEIDLVIQPNELRIDVFRAGGHGGQSVNTTDSAVRITHLPTGEVVVCQDEKSQIKNKAKAMKVLRTRLLERMEREKNEKEAAERRSQVGSGFRNERIRTYNYPQGRVTDHRIGFTSHNLSGVMEGEFDDVIGALSSHYKLEALKNAQ